MRGHALRDCSNALLPSVRQPSPARGRRVWQSPLLLPDVPVRIHAQNEREQRGAARTQGGRRRAGRAGGVEECGPDGRQLPKMHEPASLLPAAADTLRRRADDRLLQVRRMWLPVAGGLIGAARFYFLTERRANALHLSQASLRTYIACHFLPCRSGCFVSLFALNRRRRP